MPLPEYPSTAAVEVSNTLVASGTLDPSAPLTELHLADGRIVRLPTALFEQPASGFEAADSAADFVAESGGQVTVPLIEERLQVGRRVVPTGKVRLRKSVQEFETALNEPLAVRTFDIERVILNQPVESAPGVRVEGDTTIYPLLEEQLILTRQLVLKEEVRVTRRDTERLDTQVVTLRREHLVVEREPAGE